MNSLVSNPFRAVAVTFALLLGAHGSFAADDRDVVCEGTRVSQAVLLDSLFPPARDLVMKPRASEGLVAFLDSPAFDETPWGNGTAPTYSTKPRIGFKDATGQLVIAPRFLFAHPCNGNFGYGPDIATFIDGHAAVLTMDGLRFIDKSGDFVGDQTFTGLYLGKRHPDGARVWVATRQESTYFGLSSKVVKEDIDTKTLQASAHVAKPMKVVRIIDTTPKAPPKGPTEGLMGELGQSPLGSLHEVLEVSQARGGINLMPVFFFASALWTLWLVLYLGWQVLKCFGMGVSTRTVALAVVGSAGAFFPIWVLGAVCAAAVIALACIEPKRTAATA